MQRFNALLSACSPSRAHLAALGVAAGTAFALGLLAANTGGASTGGGKGRTITVQEGQGEMDPEAMMEMMEQISAPGEHHKSLEVFVGQWKTEFKNLMPGMDALNSTGTATFKMTMDGRFLHHDSNSTMMGTPMHGVGINGYHTAKQRYEGIWYSNIGTPIYYLTGEKTADGWTYEGEETDPMSGQSYPIRHVIKMDGNDKFTFTQQYPAEVAAMMGMEAQEGQEWVGGFDVVYTRAQPGGNGIVPSRGNNSR